MTLIVAAVAIFLRLRIRDYALTRADDPSRTRYACPITVVFGAVLGVLVSLCSVSPDFLFTATGVTGRSSRRMRRLCVDCRYCVPL